MSLPAIDQGYLVDFLVNLLNIPSPTGFAQPAIAFVEQELSQFSQLQLTRTRKGALIAKWNVESDLPPIALTAHVDTLGAVVKEIKSNGRLKLSRIGGVEWPTVETEGVFNLVPAFVNTARFLSRSAIPFRFFTNVSSAATWLFSAVISLEGR